MKRSLVILGTVVLVLVGCSKSNKYESLETELTSKATKYYEDYLKGKVLGINNHQITLEALANAKVDIKNFTKESCDKSSYALIKLEIDEEGKQVGDIKVENHLTCGEYTTGSGK